VAVGRVELSAQEAERRSQIGDKVILVLDEMERTDMYSAKVAGGILTVLGGPTSHAAMFARRVGIPAVTGVHTIKISRGTGVLYVGDHVIHAGDWISLDGSTGEVFEGAVQLIDPRPEEPLRTYLEWESRYRPRMKFDICTLPAYKGDEPYVFVSYAHEDADAVYGELFRLTGLGFRLWYDEGIAPSSDWPDEVASALDSCALLLVFLSPNAIASSNVRREIMYAIRKRKPCLPVYIADCQLAGGLELSLADVQHLARHRTPPERYEEKLTETLDGYGVRGPE